MSDVQIKAHVCLVEEDYGLQLCLTARSQDGVEKARVAIDDDSAPLFAFIWVSLFFGF